MEKLTVLILYAGQDKDTADRIAMSLAHANFKVLVRLASMTDKEAILGSHAEDQNLPILVLALVSPDSVKLDLPKVLKDVRRDQPEASIFPIYVKNIDNIESYDWLTQDVYFDLRDFQRNEPYLLNFVRARCQQLAIRTNPVTKSSFDLAPFNVGMRVVGTVVGCIVGAIIGYNAGLESFGFYSAIGPFLAFLFGGVSGFLIGGIIGLFGFWLIATLALPQVREALKHYYDNSWRK